MKLPRLKHPMHDFSWTEWTLVGIVCASVLLIGVSFCVKAAQVSPQEQAEQELARISHEYYLTYVYPHLLGTLETDPEEAFSPYAQPGIPTTYLRQLLHHNNDEYIDSAPIFERLGCDTNRTGVRYYPVAPYGPKDYTVTYIWNCEDGDFPRP